MRVSFLRPLDQYLGSHRLLHEFQECLRSGEYDRFRFMVAFARSGPLLRLLPDVEAFRDRGGVIEAIFGIDHLGTSRQALELALGEFESVHVTYSTSSVTLKPTFHPKLYLFSGAEHGVCFCGSHNLTVGGTETNLEAAVRIDYLLADDRSSFEDALQCWESLLPANCQMTRPLDAALLDELSRRGLLLDEKQPRVRQSPVLTPSLPSGTVLSSDAPLAPLFPRLDPKPPSALPRQLLAGASTKGTASASSARKSAKKAAKQPTRARVLPAAVGEVLVIQIRPHHNGEVFLSTRAVTQNPEFFGTFNGLTVPKANNPPYPQRVPDPIVNIAVYDAANNVVLAKPGFGLNMVLYERKSELRITFSTDLRAAVQPLAVMVMRRVSGDREYDIDIYNPGGVGTLYEQYLSVCNQTLPAGGSGQARRMGWL